MFPYPTVLNKNIILDAVRLLAWLLWHPIAWKGYLADIKPELSPDFALLHLTYEQRQEPKIQKVLLLTFFILPILVVFTVFLAIFPFATAENIGIALGYSLMLTLTCCWVGSVIVSFAFGTIYGITNGLLLGIFTGVVNQFSDKSLVILFVIGIALFSLALASTSLNRLAAVNMPFQLENYADENKNILKVIFASSLLGIVLYALLVIFKDIFTSLQMKISISLDVKILTIVLLILVLLTIFWSLRKACQQQIKSWSIKTLFILYKPLFVEVFLLFLILTNIAFLKQSSLIFSAIFGISDGAFYTFLFAFPFLIARNFIGTWIASFTAVFVSTLVIIKLLPDQNNLSDPFIIMVCIAFISFGSFYHQWRVILFYPFVTLWHLILLSLEKEKKSREHSLLRYHAAFWDAEQWIPFYKLEQHIYLARQQYPEEVEQALSYLNTTKQYWVVHDINIMSDMSAMYDCRNIHEISQIYQKSLVKEQINDTASETLRVLKRISQDIEDALCKEDFMSQLNLTNFTKQLDDLIRELHRTRGKYIKNYQIIAIRWRDHIYDHIQVIREMKNVVDIPNLYVTGSPLTPNHPLFVGRKDIVNEIEKLLLNQNSPALLLFAQRRMGKTSLLYNINFLLSNDILPILIDLQGVTAKSTHENDFFYSFARDLFAAVKQYSDLSLSEINRNELNDNPLLYLDSLFDEIEQKIEGRDILLMLDELMSLEHLFNIGQLQPSIILGWLRSQIQHRTRLKVLLSDSHPLTELKHWATYLINVQIIHVSFLTPHETCLLIEKPMPNFPLYYKTEAINRILELTFCHPALVQLMCYHIVKLKNEQPKEQKFIATLEDIEAAAVNTLIQAQFYFADIENQLVESERKILRFIAQQGEKAKVSFETIVQNYSECHEKHLQRLTELELIGTHFLNEHQYYLQVELIRRYFDKTFNNVSVRN